MGKCSTLTSLQDLSQQMELATEND